MTDSIFKLKPELIKGGFKVVKPNVNPRLIISSSAHEKCGKTHWAIQAPGPVAYFNSDRGDEGVVDKLSAGLDIAQYDIIIPPPKRGDSEESKKSKYSKIWDDFAEHFRLACESGQFRTLVVDTHGEMWGLVRLARFGKLEKVLPEHYPPVTAEFVELSQYPKSFRGLNAIYIHKLGKQYTAGKDGKRGEWNGAWESKSCGDLKYVANVNIEHFRYTRDDRPDPGFALKVINNRLRPELDGTVYDDSIDQEFMTFKALARDIYPDTPDTYWE